MSHNGPQWSWTLVVHQGGLWSPWSTWSTSLSSDPNLLKFYRKCGPGWIRVDHEDQGDHNPPWWTRTGFYILLMHIAPLATCQYTFPNTIYLVTVFTTVLVYQNSPSHQGNVVAWYKVVLNAPGTPRGVVVLMVHLVHPDPLWSTPWKFYRKCGLGWIKVDQED